MDSGAIVWIIFVIIVIGMPIYLDHRQKMAKLLGGKSDPDEKNRGEYAADQPHRDGHELDDHPHGTTETDRGR